MPKVRPLFAGRQHQHGASAIEFGILFPLLLAIVYGGITYGLVFFLQQRVNFAAQEGARAAIAVDPAAPGYFAVVTSNANLAVIQNFSAPGATVAPARLTTAVSPGSTIGTVQVTVTYNLGGAPASGGGAATGALFPTIVLPVIGPVPVVPANLQATAVGRLS